MNTDSPLDLQIKSGLLVDLFNIVSFRKQDTADNNRLNKQLMKKVRS